MLRIKVKTLQPATYDLEVPSDERFDSLKERLVPIAGIPLDRQRLIYKGRVLRDDQTLRDTGVEEGDALHLVERPPDAPQQPAAAGPVPSAGGRVPVNQGNIAQLLQNLFSASMPTADGQPNMPGFLGAPVAGQPPPPVSEPVHLLAAIDRFMSSLEAGGGVSNVSPIPVTSIAARNVQGVQQHYNVLTQAISGVLQNVPLGQQLQTMLESAQAEHASADDPEAAFVQQQQASAAGATGTTGPRAMPSYRYVPLVVAAVVQLLRRLQAYNSNTLSPVLSAEIDNLAGIERVGAENRAAIVAQLRRAGAALHGAAALTTELARTVAATCLAVEGNIAAVASNSAAVINTDTLVPSFPPLLPRPSPAPGQPEAMMMGGANLGSMISSAISAAMGGAVGMPQGQAPGPGPGPAPAAPAAGVIPPGVPGVPPGMPGVPVMGSVMEATFTGPPGAVPGSPGTFGIGTTYRLGPGGERHGPGMSFAIPGGHPAFQGMFQGAVPQAPGAQQEAAPGAAPNAAAQPEAAPGPQVPPAMPGMEGDAGGAAIQMDMNNILGQIFGAFNMGGGLPNGHPAYRDNMSQADLQQAYSTVASSLAPLATTVASTIASSLAEHMGEPAARDRLASTLGPAASELLRGVVLSVSQNLDRIDASLHDMEARSGQPASFADIIRQVAGALTAPGGLNQHLGNAAAPQATAPGNAEPMQGVQTAADGGQPATQQPAPAGQEPMQAMEQLAAPAEPSARAIGVPEAALAGTTTPAAAGPSSSAQQEGGSDRPAPRGLGLPLKAGSGTRTRLPVKRKEAGQDEGASGSAAPMQTEPPAGSTSDQPVSSAPDMSSLMAAAAQMLQSASSGGAPASSAAQPTAQQQQPDMASLMASAAQMLQSAGAGAGAAQPNSAAAAVQQQQSRDAPDSTVSLPQAAGAGRQGGSGGGGMDGLMRMAMQMMGDPAMQPIMQQAAGMLMGGGRGGGAGGGLANMLGGLMSSMGGGGGASSRSAPARRPRSAVANLDALKELPEEDAAKWRGMIEADLAAQEEMPPPAEPSEAYLAGVPVKARSFMGILDNPPASGTS